MWDAILSTIAAWFVGLVLDANLISGSYRGFLCLRVLLPMLVMGAFILHNLRNKNKAEDSQWHQN